MPLVTSRGILRKAMEAGYAVPAFNVENMETVQAVISGAEELNSPVIVQTTPSSVKYGGLNFFYSNVYTAALDSKVPVVLHLDHGSSFELAVKAIRSGYTSVMIDGSKLPFKENAEITKKVVDIGSVVGVPVEAELGRVGGKEDELKVEDKDAFYTDPQEAVEFVKLTGIDCLAVAIGTAHGLYKGEPKLDFERLRKIRNLVNIPLVLHGATGVPEDSVRRAVSIGICKVNYATELRLCMTQTIRKILENDRNIIDPKEYLGAARDAIKDTVKDKILLCGSQNKA